MGWETQPLQASKNLSVSVGGNTYGCSLIQGGVEMKRKFYYLLLAVGIVIGFMFILGGLLAYYPASLMVAYIGIAVLMLALHFTDKH